LAVQNAIKLAANHLTDVQNDDGGFDWIEDGNTTTGSSTNVVGVTALGILKAYELKEKAIYETALAEVYMYLHNTGEPSYNWDGTKYTEFFHPGDPDLYFLVWLAEAAAADPTLMAAITAKVPTTTSASQIADMARTRWDNRVLYMGASATPANGNATTYAQRERDRRYDASQFGLIPWNLSLQVNAALALDDYYPGQGYDTQADDIAEVIFDSMGSGNPYFNTDDDTAYGYTIGIAGAVDAFASTELHSGRLATYTALLLSTQEGDGSWNADYQDTAYCVLALMKEGSTTSVNAAQDGADWLESVQDAGGGWLYSPTEYLEVTSEAAYAMYMSLGSSSIGLTASIPDIVAISATPTTIDFGTLLPGQSSDSKYILVENVGTRTVDIDASVIGSSSMITDNLWLRQSDGSPGWDQGSPWDDIILGLVMGDDEELETILEVPSSHVPAGTETATLLFEATAD
jgi:hypothetical protein